MNNLKQIAIFIVAFMFLMSVTPALAQIDETDQCDALMTKLNNQYKSCFGGELIEEFVPRMINAFGKVNIETQMGMLDVVVSQLRSNPSSRMLIVVYGGKVNKYGEIKARTDFVITYLTKFRKVPEEKITVVNGGFREKFEIELWTSRSKDIFPKLSPTVDPEKVRFRGKMEQFPPPGL